MNEQIPQAIKKINVEKCPSCGQTIYISSQTMLPVIGPISTISDMKKAKEDVIKGLESIQFVSEEEKQNIINNLPTHFDLSDVESLISGIGKNQISRIQANESAKNKTSDQDKDK